MLRSGALVLGVAAAVGLRVHPEAGEVDDGEAAGEDDEGEAVNGLIRFLRKGSSRRLRANRQEQTE